MDITFSVNLYDNEGDVFQEGVYLHIEPHLILKLDSVDDIDKMIKQLAKIRDEIKSLQ